MEPGSSHSPQGSPEDALDSLASEITACRRCPRLVAWREKVASERRASYREEQYWGKPVPGLGDADARLLVVGLAPAAHGANRTGRMFTGDRSGDWLFAALSTAGFASRPASAATAATTHLRCAYLTAAVRCAPPANKPSPSEKEACIPFLAREMDLLDGVRVVVALGHLAYQAVARIEGLRPRPKFAHGAEIPLPPRPARPGDGSHPRTLICSYHPSQQNTFTGKLTREMLGSIFERARALCADPAGPAGAPSRRQ